MPKDFSMFVVPKKSLIGDMRVGKMEVKEFIKDLKEILSNWDRLGDSEDGLNTIMLTVVQSAVTIAHCVDDEEPEPGREALKMFNLRYIKERTKNTEFIDDFLYEEDDEDYNPSDYRSMREVNRY